MLSRYCRAHARIKIILIALSLFLFSSALFAVSAINATNEAAYASDAYFSGEGTSDNPFLIQNKNDLLNLSALVNGGEKMLSDKLYSAQCYRLETDVDLSGASFSPIGTTDKANRPSYYIAALTLSFDENNRPVFTKIKPNASLSETSLTIDYGWATYRSIFYTKNENDGYDVCDLPLTDYSDGTIFYFKYSFDKAFFGTFDGNGKTVSNLTLNGETETGLFGYVVNAEIKNLTIVGANVASSVENAAVGSVAGKVSSSVITNCAVVSSSVSASGVGAAAGGGAGHYLPTIAYPAHETLQGTSILPYLEDFFNTPKTPSCSFFAINDSEVHGEIGGGVIGVLEEGTLSDCLSAVSSANAFIGSRPSLSTEETEKPEQPTVPPVIVKNVLATRCFNGKFVLFKDTDEYVNLSNCIYPSDIATLTDSFPSCSLKATDILTKSTSELGLNGWFTFDNNGDEYYYPTPIQGVKIGITAYSVTVDGKNQGLFPIKCDSTNSIFSLPEPDTADGYDFAYYEINSEHFAGNDEIAITRTTAITTYRSLSPIDPDHIPIIRDFSTVYSAEPQIAANATYPDPFGRKVSYEWYFSADNNGVFEKTDINDADLRVLGTSDSGYYYCVVSVTKPDGSAINLPDGQETVSIETQPFACTVSKRPVTLKLSCSTEKSDSSHVYDGVSYGFTANYTATNLPDVLQSKLTAAIEITFTLNGKTVSAAKDAGKYVCSALFNDETLVSDCDFNVITDSYDVSPAEITCSVTNYDELYDEKAHSVAATGQTVDGTPVSVAYSLDDKNYDSVLFSFTDVINTTIYVRFSAKNHAETVKTCSFSISPVAVTLTATELNVSKIYDGTTVFPVETITSEHYAASCSGTFSGVPVFVTKANSDIASSGNVTVTAKFALASENFFLTNDSIALRGFIDVATIKIFPKNAITAVYNGTTNFYSAVTENDYSINVNSSATPFISVYSATANSKDVATASVLTVTFALPNRNYVFENGNGVYEFDFTLDKKTVVVKNSSLIRAVNREYNGSTAVDVVADPDAFKGFVGEDETEVIFYDCTIPSENASETAYPVTLGSALPKNANYKADISSLYGLFVSVIRATPKVNPVVTSDFIYSSATSLPSVSLSDGDTRGTIKWNLLSLNANGTIDLAAYPTDENGYASFGYSFSPFDGNNYNKSVGSVHLKIIKVAAVNLDVVYAKDPIFFAFEKINVDFLTVTLINNDGTRIALSPGTNGYEISYLSAPSGFRAGDEYFVVGYAADSVVLTKQIPVTVNKIPLSSVASKGEFTYNAALIGFFPTNYDESFMTIENNTALDVGDYSAKLSIKNDLTANYVFDNGESFCFVPFSVIPLKKYAPFLGVTSFAYTGEPISADIKNDYNSGSDFFTLSGELTAVDAGSYSVTVTLISQNYFWAETNDASPLTLSWEIRRVSVALPFINDLPFTYDGEEHTVSVTAEKGCIVTGDLTYFRSGNYAITVSLDNPPNKNNYVWVDGTTDSVTLNYEVAKTRVSAPTMKTLFVYSGSYVTVPVHSTEYYDVSGITREINAGHYRFIVSLKNKLDYVWNDETSSSSDIVVNWQIAKLTIKLPSIAGQNGYTANEQSAFISYDERYCFITGNVGTNAGEYEATVSLKNTKNTIFSDGSETAKKIGWRIVKAVVDKPSAPKNVLYNGLEQTALVASSDVYVVKNAVATVAGTYNVTVSLVDKNNYSWSDNTSDDISFEWKICKLTVSGGSSDVVKTDYSLGSALFTPVRDGYKFDGWYLTSDFSGEKITSITELDGDVTVYAKWIRINAATTDNNGNKGDDPPVLSTKAIVGIALVGGALLIGLLIILFALAKGKKRTPTDKGKGLF